MHPAAALYAGDESGGVLAVGEYVPDDFRSRFDSDSGVDHDTGTITFERDIHHDLAVRQLPLHGLIVEPAARAQVAIGRSVPNTAPITLYFTISPYDHGARGVRDNECAASAAAVLALPCSHAPRCWREPVRDHEMLTTKAVTAAIRVNCAARCGGGIQTNAGTCGSRTVRRRKYGAIFANLSEELPRNAV